MILRFDFTTIFSLADFYQALKNQITLPDYFGNNLDALYDFLTVEAPLPLTMEFSQLSSHQRSLFGALISTLKEIEAKEPLFTFIINR